MMKKTYTKPTIWVESFTLSQSIASCGDFSGSTTGKPTAGDQSNCGWDLGNMIVWVAAPACNFEWGADDAFSGVCYNNPNGGVTIFGS